MPAATCRAELLAVTDKEWAKLTATLDRVSDDIAMVPLGDDPSPRDIVTHRAHWIGLFFQWLREGEAAQMPDHGVKWTQLKPYNTGLRAQYADMSWNEARNWLNMEHTRLRAWIAGAGDDVLYGAPMPGGTGWTTGRYAEAAGPSHYRSAAKYVRGVLRQSGTI
ncbi:ClbS/DfsB family four-helix bundle protein [Hasllibacter sp. MH4015]|uniref:ClbS/DfsB family four-helix bundle protein n=1 Tax=Hasllibacter sp. MH4015 TaxID=2854029 RepID=UPI001CD816EA|nr:ClbS/DfsB family four-helix bundle protein [Hasllibacter sp. MH4015]